ncbi:membrane protein of unknown function [Methylocella tundrae]|uniref:NADH:quinone oxidoreductase/Mrp antiporter transmembrane domain-containing protein n=1 Tax=Methylocella tundrae TaxID=227605 RepID=A0A4U8YV32_METTU|nr:membrane protein of unknown function [Methylocella tundrae]
MKAGVIGMIRFLPLGAALPGWGETLAAIGLFSAFYGVAIGVTQQNPKTVLAYSSISQMGVIAAVLGMGLAAGDRSAALDAAFYGAHHVIVKGALFLAVGVAAASSRRRLWLTLAPALVLALSLGGIALDRRRAGETRGQDATGRRPCWRARSIFGGGHHAFDAAFPAPSRRRGLAGGRSSGAGRAHRTLARNGAGGRAGSLAALSADGRPRRRCADPLRALGRAVAGSHRRCARPPVAALGRPPAPPARGGHCRHRRGRLPQKLRHWRGFGAGGRRNQAVARRRRLASRSGHRFRRRDDDPALTD